MTAAISRPLAGWMGPRSSTIEMAQNKAYTALFGVSTQDFFNFIQGDPSLLAGIPTLARVAAWGGGFPIKVNGEIVGAIGVSGAPTVQNDVDCARAALALVPDAVPGELRNKGATMMIHTHQTAPTQFVEANGIRFAYRRFGKPGGVPLVFNQHFTGTMDHWDPAVTDGFADDARGHPVQQRRRLQQLRRGADYVRANGRQRGGFHQGARPDKVDVLGFSIGGLVAQEIALQGPELVRRLVLVGTGPRGGEGMATLTPEAQAIFGATYDDPDDLWLRVLFTPSEKSQAAGREFLKRFRLRNEDRDPEVNEKVAPAQIAAIGKWGAPREKPFDYLKIDPPADAGRQRQQ